MRLIRSWKNSARTSSRLEPKTRTDCTVLNRYPFFNNYKAQFFGDAELTAEQIALLVDLTQDVTSLLETELKLKGFWERIPAQNRVKGHLLDLILSPEYKDKLPDAFNKRQVFISSTMQIAKLKNETILYV